MKQNKNSPLQFCFVNFKTATWFCWILKSARPAPPPPPLKFDLISMIYESTIVFVVDAIVPCHLQICRLNRQKTAVVGKLTGRWGQIFVFKESSQLVVASIERPFFSQFKRCFAIIWGKKHANSKHNTMSVLNQKRWGVGTYTCRLKGFFLASNVVVFKCRWHGP
jgi:hypothetical protein